MVSFRRLMHRRNHDPPPAPEPEPDPVPAASAASNHRNSDTRTSDPPRVVFARGSFTGTPLTDTPEPGSLRSSYGSAVHAAPPVLPLPPVLPSLPVGGPIAPGALLGGPARLSDGSEMKDSSQPVRPTQREADVHSSLHGDIVLPALHPDERRGLLDTSLDSQYSDPFKTPPRSNTTDRTRAHIPSVIPETDERSRSATPNTSKQQSQHSGVSSEPTERATPKQSDHLPLLHPKPQPQLQPQSNPATEQPNQVEYLQPLEAIDRLSPSHSGASTPAHFFSSASTPLPHTPRSEPASPPDSPHLSPLHAAGSLPATPDAQLASLREVSRSPPASRHNSPPPPAAPDATDGQAPAAPSPIPGAPWGAQKDVASTAPAAPPAAQDVHDCTSHRVLLHGHRHKHTETQKTQSYRPRPESISWTSPSSNEEHTSKFLRMPRFRRSSTSSASSEDDDQGHGLRALEIKADSEEMAAGTRSIAWCDDLREFHGPIPAALIGGRFPPLELTEEKSPLVKVKGLPKAGLKRVGSAISSVAGSRSGSRAASRAGSVRGGEEGLGDNTFGLDINDALSLDPNSPDAIHPSARSAHSAEPFDLSTWPAPRRCPSTLNLSDPLTGRVYTASRLGGSIGSKKIVKFFLGSESDHAQSEARAYELTDGGGVTPKWYGAYGGFHPRIGSGRTRRANQVLLYALVSEDMGEAVVVEKLWKKEKRAIAKLYHTLHAHGVLHNTPAAEHWRTSKNGFRLVSFSEALFRDDMDEDDWDECCKAEDRVVANLLGLGED